MIFLAARPSLLGPADASEAWPRGGGGGRSARSMCVPWRMEISGGGSLAAGRADVVRRAVSLLDRCDNSHGALVSVCCAQCCRCTPGATRAGARARPARLPDLAGRPCTAADRSRPAMRIVMDLRVTAQRGREVFVWPGRLLLWVRAAGGGSAAMVGRCGRGVLLCGAAVLGASAIAGASERSQVLVARAQGAYD